MCKHSKLRRNYQLELEFTPVKPHLDVLFWGTGSDSERLILVLPNQAGEEHHKTNFLQGLPNYRYRTGGWSMSTHAQKMLAGVNEKLLPYNGKVLNSLSSAPQGEENWCDYYFEFDTEEDRLNFLLAWI